MKTCFTPNSGDEYFVEGDEVWYPAREKVALDCFAYHLGNKSMRFINGKVWVKSVTDWPVVREELK